METLWCRLFFGFFRIFSICLLGFRGQFVWGWIDCGELGLEFAQVSQDKLNENIESGMQVSQDKLESNIESGVSFYGEELGTCVVLGACVVVWESRSLHFSKSF